MALQDFLKQRATIRAQAETVDALGGVVRTPYAVVASDVPCLVRPQVNSLAGEGQGRAGSEQTLRIYFATDPQVTSASRIDVDGVYYRPIGSQDPNSLGRIFQVDCEQVIE